MAVMLLFHNRFYNYRERKLMSNSQKFCLGCGRRPRGAYFRFPARRHLAGYLCFWLLEGPRHWFDALQLGRELIHITFAASKWQRHRQFIPCQTLPMRSERAGIALGRLGSYCMKPKFAPLNRPMLGAMLDISLGATPNQVASLAAY